MRSVPPLDSATAFRSLRRPPDPQASSWLDRLSSNRSKPQPLAHSSAVAAPQSVSDVASKSARRIPPHAAVTAQL